MWYTVAMIGYLRGTVLVHDIKWCIIDISGVGYRVAPSPNAFASMALGKECAVYVYTSVREDALDLFAFQSPQEQEFFEQLLSVSGVGPRSALGILGLAPIDGLRNAIASSDVAYLTKVSGIGKKTAEKIIVELRDKVARGMEVVTFTAQEHTDLIDALQSLGYGLPEIRNIVPQVGDGSTQEKLKIALRLLSR